MATYTSNYQLHQWEPRDAFLRTDFNSDFQKIDQSLAQVRALAGEKCSAVAGSYTGDGAAIREIRLGFHPLVVLLEISFGKRPAVDYYMYGGLAVRGGGLSHSSNTALCLTENGFTVTSGAECGTNNQGYTYRYLAIWAGE